MTSHRTDTRPVRKEVNFSDVEWSKSRELFDQVKGGRGYVTYMDFARDMLMYGTVHMVKVATDPAHLRASINRIGSNINQIAHAANSTGSITQEQIRDIKSDLKCIYDLLSSLNEKFNETIREGW